MFGGLFFLNLSHPFALRLCLGALLCCPVVGAIADPLPSVSVVAPAPVATVTQLPKSLTSVVVDYGDSTRGESVKLLESRVTFKVKDASFLTALDAVLASANRSCRVECRGVKAMKLTLDLKNNEVAPILDTLARAGSARLWVFPAKLLLAPEALLTDDEKKTAKLYGVLVSLNDLPTGNELGRTKNGKSILDVMNIKISTVLNNATYANSYDRLGGKEKELIGIKYIGMVDGRASTSSISTSVQNVNYGEVLALVAHANGCELFLLANAYVICPPDKSGFITGEQEAQKAVPAFTPSSTHFNFNLDPSAPNA